MQEEWQLSNHTTREQIIDTIHDDVEQWSCSEFQDGHRKHLGASQIGTKCPRQLWYQFRWFKAAFYKIGGKTHGQMLRLFNRGQREEYEFQKILEGIGCKFDHTPDDQVRIEDVDGHFGGSLDNVGTLPERYGIPEKILFEYKTFGSRYFADLKKKGMKISQEKHYAQMCVYGYKLGLNFGLYVAVNKDTDELHFELVRLDHQMGEMYVAKGAFIIKADTPPERISQTPTHFSCKWCSFKESCFYGALPEKNCRSCKYAKPAANKQWYCRRHENIIPETFIIEGCDKYEPAGQ